MFCQTCGTSCQKNANFCETCGTALITNDGKKEKDGNSTSQPLSFKEYMESRHVSQKQDMSFTAMQKRKTNERSQSIKKRAKKNEIVQINIGIAESDNTGRQLKIKRGSLLPIDVKKCDSHVVVKNLAMEKQFAHNKQLRECDQCEWVLLYPDFDLVLTIPGKSEPFSVEHYKESIGKPFSRVNLYLCKLADYESANDLESDPESDIRKESKTSIASKEIQNKVAVPQLDVEINLSEEGNTVDLSEEGNTVGLSQEWNTVDETTQVLADSLPTGIFEDQNFEDIGSSIDCFADELAKPMESEILVIHRSNVKCDLLNHFVNDTLLHKIVDVKMLDPRGMEEKGEGVGVVRDAFSLFWNDVYNSYMLGEDERVPIIRHDVSREKWQAIARILLKGYMQERYFPIKISKVFLCSCLFGEDTVTEDMYLDSFMKYVSKTEAHLIERVLSNSLSTDHEEVVDFLSAFECKKLVTAANFREVVIEIAHKELVQKPRYVCDCWMDVLYPLKSFVTTRDALFEIYQSLYPTAAKVCKIIKADPQTSAERESISHLKRWIKGLDENALAKFLRFSTGSDVILCEAIKITFTTLAGKGRRPFFHTCGSVIELPATYDDFCDFREEWCSIISNVDIEMGIA
ncbi:uncharacterized protein LOC114532099 [Dendronephthya gigantea]|uniref:uncharacterized protein LOC114532099 n=1 Tax=Dendronephthya gigantea TaxID=151771 RepID=UPI001069EC2C|nr:uncharacterized protein LOC114532099 [Dendronephthya gigantea]